MTDTANAQWWWRHDGERFDGPFDTREAAIAEAEVNFGTDDGFYICQATKPTGAKLSKHFEADYFIEQSNEDSAEFMGEDGDPLFDPNADQEADLQEIVRAAIDAWQEKHKLVFTQWCFDWQGPSEWISTKPDEEGNAE